MKRQLSFWEEFKESGWFDRVLLIFPWLLVGMVIVLFIPELMKYGTL